jgi:CRISPR-associated protein Csm2
MTTNGGFSSGQKSYGQQPVPQNLPQAVKISGFYESGGNVNSDLFDKTAGAVASSIIGVTGTQLRRIFDEVKRFEQLLDTSSGDEEDEQKIWKKHEPYIRMIKSKVSYTIARAINKANQADANGYRNLSKFITKCIDLVKDTHDYRVFVALFEAVYGFYYEKAPNRASK